MWVFAWVFASELEKKFFGKCDPSAPQMKLCTVPKNTKLIEKTAAGKPFRYPVVTVENVIVLPGIPQLFERSIQNLIGYWETDRAGGAFYLKPTGC